MTILDEIANETKQRVLYNKNIKPLDILKTEAYSMQKGNFSFENKIKNNKFSFICECKKASPSKGIIAENFPYLDIAIEYEQAGADCISVLTEPKWFLGKDEYLKEITHKVSIPCLRKDFIVDEYMIYEAKTLGAACVLLICSILSDKQLKEYINICDELGLSALVETHNEKEIEMAIKSNARMIGINNRNLKDFSVDTENSKKLSQYIPKDILFISESGVTNANDIKNLYDIGANAVLIGETLMKAKNKKEKLQELKSLL